MNTRRALGVYRGDKRELAGPLDQHSEKYIKAWDERQQSILARKVSGPGIPAPVVAALRRKLGKVTSEQDRQTPLVMRFDAFQVAKSAVVKNHTDRGVVHLAQQLEQMWHHDPMGSLTLGQLSDMREHYRNSYPKSKATSVIDNDIYKVGYNTLPVAKLARIAARIEDQADFDYQITAAGLSGDRPDQVRSRSLIRELVALKGNTVDHREPVARDQRTATERASDRIAQEIGLGEVPLPEDELGLDEPPVDLDQEALPPAGGDVGGDEGLEQEVSDIAEFAEEVQQFVQDEAPPAAEPYIQLEEQEPRPDGQPGPGPTPGTAEWGFSEAQEGHQAPPPSKEWQQEELEEHAEGGTLGGGPADDMAPPTEIDLELPPDDSNLAPPIDEMALHASISKQSKSPPGWSKWIEHRKSEGMKPETAFATAWSKYNKGQTPHKQASKSTSKPSKEACGERMGASKPDPEGRTPIQTSAPKKEMTGPGLLKSSQTAKPGYMLVSRRTGEPITEKRSLPARILTLLGRHLDEMGPFAPLTIPVDVAQRLIRGHPFDLTALEDNGIRMVPIDQNTVQKVQNLPSLTQSPAGSPVSPAPKGMGLQANKITASDIEKALIDRGEVVKIGDTSIHINANDEVELWVKDAGRVCELKNIDVAIKDFIKFASDEIRPNINKKGGFWVVDLVPVPCAKCASISFFEPVADDGFYACDCGHQTMASVISALVHRGAIEPTKFVSVRFPQQYVNDEAATVDLANKIMKHVQERSASVDVQHNDGMMMKLNIPGMGDGDVADLAQLLSRYGIRQFNAQSLDPSAISAPGSADMPIAEDVTKQDITPAAGGQQQAPGNEGSEQHQEPHITAAFTHYKDMGLSLLEAIKQFVKDYSEWVENHSTPETEAEILGAIQQLYTSGAPATPGPAQDEGAAEPPTPGFGEDLGIPPPGAGATATGPQTPAPGAGRSMMAQARKILRMAFKNPKVNAQQPDSVKVQKQPLGGEKDNDTGHPSGLKQPGIKVKHPAKQKSPTDLGQHSDDKDPGRFKATKPPSDGHVKGKAGDQPGTKAPSTGMHGKDSDNNPKLSIPVPPKFGPRPAHK